MEAIVLAGGFGTRLRSVVSDVPKPMAPVAGRPFLEFLLDYMSTQSIDHAVLSVGYMHETIERHFGEKYNNIHIDYAIETTPLGTGGGILNAFSKCETNNVVVLNGDTLFSTDLSILHRFHKDHKAALSMIMRHVDDASRYGSVVVNDANRIVGFVEKNNSQGVGTINGGIYMLSRTLFSGYAVGDSFSFEKDILQKRFSDIPMYAYAAGDYFIDIGVPEDYRSFVARNC